MLYFSHTAKGLFTALKKVGNAIMPNQKKIIDDEKIEKIKSKYEKNKDIKYASYVSELEHIVGKLLTHNLSYNDFPHTSDSTGMDKMGEISKLSHNISWRNKVKHDINFIILIIGGVSSYEIGEVNKLNSSIEKKIVLISNGQIKYQDMFNT